MRRAKCFGINLAKIDIRQESSRHTQLLAEYIKKKENSDYLNWDEQKRIKYLSKSMKKKIKKFQKFFFSK